MICLLLCTYEFYKIIITTDVLREQRRMRKNKGGGRHGRYFLLSSTVWSFTALFFKQKRSLQGQILLQMSPYPPD